MAKKKHGFIIVIETPEGRAYILSWKARGDVEAGIIAPSRMQFSSATSIPVKFDTRRTAESYMDILNVPKGASAYVKSGKPGPF